MESQALDTLVKLASLGTAGICVVIIVATGLLIYKLPKGTADNKISLINTYIKANVIIAIICAISGVTNAYFNHGKIVEAQSETAALQDSITKQINIWENEKSTLENSINSIKSSVQNQPNISPATKNELNALQLKVNKITFKPFIKKMNIK